MNKGRGISVIAATLVTGIMLVSIADGQTRRRPRPAPTPTASASVPVSPAEIISQDPGRPLVTPEQAADPAVDTPADTSSNEINGEKIKELRRRVKDLESNRADPYDTKQKRLLLNLDILTRAEQRSESLRKQLFDLMEKETSVQAKLDDLDFEMRPEMINRSTTSIMGSMHPEDLRAAREKTLKAEQANFQNMLTQIETTKAELQMSLSRSEALVDKLRAKLEKDIDDSLAEDDTQ